MLGNAVAALLLATDSLWGSLLGSITFAIVNQDPHDSVEPMVDDANLAATSIAAAQWASVMVLLVFSLVLWLREFRNRNAVEANSLFSSGTKTIYSTGLLDLFVFLFAASLFSTLLNFQTTESTQVFFIGMAHILSCLLVYFHLFWQNSTVAQWLRLSPRELLKELGSGIKGAVLVLPGLLLLHRLLSLWIPYQHESITNWPETWLGVVSRWWLTVIATGFFEEFVFRGLLIAWLVNLYPPDLFRKRITFRQILIGSPDRQLRSAPTPPPSGFIEPERSGSTEQASSSAVLFAVIVSAVLFSLAHWSQGAAPVSLFLLGLFLGWLFLKTRSLWACIFTHMLFNAYSLFWATLGHVWSA